MSKKPAKRRTSDPSVVVKKVDTGFNVRFIGSKGFPHTCPICGSQRGKGMVREYKTVLYCGTGCVMKHKRLTEVETV
jgi:hypothetical protein